MHAELVIHIVYDAATTTKEYVREQLDHAANYLANTGAFTGVGTAVVDNWDYHVEVK